MNQEGYRFWCKTIRPFQNYPQNIISRAVLNYKVKEHSDIQANLKKIKLYCGFKSNRVGIFILKICLNIKATRYLHSLF